MAGATLTKDAVNSSETVLASTPRQPGSAVGIVTYIADDFDALLDYFEDDGQDEGLETPR